MRKQKHWPVGAVAVLYDGAEDGAQVQVTAYLVNRWDVGITFGIYVTDPRLAGDTTGRVDRFGDWEDSFYLSRQDTRRLVEILRRRPGQGTLKVVRQSFSGADGLKRLKAFCAVHGLTLHHHGAVGCPEEIDRIGFLPGGAEVYVETDDPGSVPHFHVRQKKSSEGVPSWEPPLWEVCLRFDRPAYYEHDDHHGTLPPGVGSELDHWLRSIDEDDRYHRIHWQMAVDSWNSQNQDRPLPLDLAQPDYGKLSEDG